MPDRGDHHAQRGPGGARHSHSRHRGGQRRQPGPHRHGQLCPVRSGDTTCQTSLVSGPGFDNVPLTASGAISGDFTPTAPGVYQWVVTYHGDPLHTPSNGQCGDTSERVAVVVVHLTKTADHAVVAAGSPIGFTITLTNPGPAPAAGLTLTDPLPAGSGVTWSIASQQGPATCVITGAPPTQTLNCPETGTFTLPAAQSQVVHVTSPTAEGVCAVVNNTATAVLAEDPVSARRGDHPELSDFNQQHPQPRQRPGGPCRPRHRRRERR